MPLLQKLKSVYIVWFEQYQKIPKLHRHTLGQRVDAMLIETIEVTNAAIFNPQKEKLPYVKIAIRKIDTIKILLLILWQTKSLSNKQYIAVSKLIDEIGKMFGGWNGQLTKQNFSNIKPEKK